MYILLYDTISCEIYSCYYFVLWFSPILRIIWCILYMLQVYMLYMQYIFIIEDVQPWSARASFQRGGLKSHSLVPLHFWGRPFIGTGTVRDVMGYGCCNPSLSSFKEKHGGSQGFQGGTGWTMQTAECQGLALHFNVKKSLNISQRNSVLKLPTKPQETVGWAMPGATQQHSSV